MKKSTWIVLLIFGIIGLGILLYAPLRTKIRSKVVRVWSKNVVASKKDEQVPESVYKWPLTDANEQPLTYDEERGKIVFLNFWATWCGPCIQEMPSIQELYDQYGDKVSFLLVTDEDSSKVQAFRRKKGITVPMYITDKEEIPDAFYASTIPTSYIIDHTGKIKMAKSGIIDVEKDSIEAVLEALIQNASR